MGTVVSFPLSTSTSSTAQVSVESPSQAARANVRDAFLGRGLLGPLRRDGKGDFAHGSGAELVKSSIRQILGLRGSSPVTQGELPWRPSLGSQLYRLRHMNNDAALIDFARVFVVEALERFEPRITLLDVNISRVETSFGKLTGLLIKLSFRLITANVPQNLVSSGVETLAVNLPLAA